MNDAPISRAATRQYFDSGVKYTTTLQIPKNLSNARVRKKGASIWLSMNRLAVHRTRQRSGQLKNPPDRITRRSSSAMTVTIMVRDMRL